MNDPNCEQADGLYTNSPSTVAATMTAETAAQPGSTHDLVMQILRAVPEPLLVFTQNGTIRALNQAVESLFGYTEQELLGNGIQQLAPSVDFGTRGREGIACWVRQEDDAEPNDALGRRKDGSTFPIDLVTNSIDWDGEHLIVAILRDATSQRNLELQLNHAQKMESIGQLAAGVAHEINTPIQYVGDNLRFLDDSFQSLSKVMHEYEKLHENDGAGARDALEEAHRLYEQEDIEYVLEEIPKAVVQSLDGTERVATIVRAMKEFSHPNTKEKSLLDINHAIESTMTVSRNEWKYVADVVTRFDVDVPAVPCLPGEFNQAILNLLVNAGHAIADKVQGKDERGTIEIVTRRDNGWVEIRISDTGTGIPESIREKVFDPFFTTKPVGRGTGQGLAVTYSAIVEKHGGTIELDSVIGKGSTFVIRLPLSR